MKQKVQNTLKNEKGLTLVELLAVIVILGIIAAIAIPSIGNIIQNSREKAVIADALNTLSAAELYFTAEDIADGGTVSLVAGSNGEPPLVGTYLDDSGSLETATVTKVSGGNTIVFKGAAGKEIIDVKSGIDKKTLNAAKNLEDLK